ncbi:MAG: hypothetical protein JO372_25395 [Solirubrobacterales bacterium]|nr:hypothetical protein [Solirubrobacterales bacterium]
MTQYLMSVHHAFDAPPPDPEEMAAAFGAVEVFNDELRRAGAWVFAGGLEAPDTATVIRINGDQAVLSDGPFTESKEHIGGFWVIEAADLDEALAWGEKGARACRRPVEVRPFQRAPEDG